jgi:hypothetical protein
MLCGGFGEARLGLFPSKTATCWHGNIVSPLDTLTTQKGNEIQSQTLWGSSVCTKTNTNRCTAPNKALSRQPKKLLMLVAVHLRFSEWQKTFR